MEILKKFYALYPTRGLKCDGCNLGEDYYSDGYRCFRSGLFFHKECANSSLDIFNLYHPQHSLKIKVYAKNKNAHGECKICRGNLPKIFYYCSTCDFAIDLICVRKEVKIEIEGPKIHEHRLFLVPEMISFTCNLCQLPDDRFPFVCNLCNLSFHKDCAESTPEINYSCHPKHPLKRLTRVPSHTGGKCCLCENKLDNLFYHCSVCNFSVDLNCVNNPPPFTLLHPKAHEHQLILMPQRSFVCNACGIDDDPNPYVCPQCNFMIHRNCIDIPRVIKINHHDHRIYYNHCLDTDDWKCGVCQKEIKWIYGAYSCPKCHSFAVHLRCATKFGIWDGIELEGISEKNIEIKSYEVIEEGLIKHSSHKNHILKLKEENDADDEGIYCEACVYPIFCGPFYSCIECDKFILHLKCADLPEKKVDSFYKLAITLFPCEKLETILGLCEVCQHFFQGFRYVTDDDLTLDVRCGSISEPFFHESHPHHPLYINLKGNKICKGCGEKETFILSCEECRFFLDIKCPFLPKMVKHKYDKNHFLFLCYGENPNDQYWCEICEEELNPEVWFYTCDDCGITLHIKCTLGDLIRLKQKIDAEPLQLELKRNIQMTRLVCDVCHSRCRFPYVLKCSSPLSVDTLCSLQCFQQKYFQKMTPLYELSTVY